MGSLLGIAAYGMWHTRTHRNLSHYLKGDETAGWMTIGISVAATQASAITFISTPGQGYESGLDFVQNYFGMPLALILIAAVFLPMYRRLKVYTAYEFLGRRFDAKTRLLGAALFLLQRGLAAGITIYAPAIILSTVLGWRLDLTIILSGLLVTIYTVTGGSQAVSLTQKYQMTIIFGGMVAALVILLVKLPASLDDAFTVAGGFKKLEAVSFSFDIQPALHLLDRPARRIFPIAVVFRHRPVAGAALPIRLVSAREPAGPDVQRHAQDSHAVLHPAARRHGFCLLPV